MRPDPPLGTACGADTRETALTVALEGGRSWFQEMTGPNGRTGYNGVGGYSSRAANENEEYPRELQSLPTDIIRATGDGVRLTLEVARVSVESRELAPPRGEGDPVSRWQP